MPSNNEFFVEQTEQSATKAKIVTSYFSAWSRVIRDNWPDNIPISYIDLFCGPGVYKDGSQSVPVILVQNVLQDIRLTTRMRFLFNDKDSSNIESLQKAISSIDGYQSLSERIRYYNNEVGSNFESSLHIGQNMPVLSFVDPFGYKGLSLELINKLIANKGSDCIFFFNYNRINMALSSNIVLSINNPKAAAVIDEMIISHLIFLLEPIINPMMPAAKHRVTMSKFILHTYFAN